MILYTYPDRLEKETKVVNTLFEEGLEIMHLRKPEASKETIQQFLDKIKPQYHSRIMIHSHYGLAEEYELRGIHFTEKSKSELSFYSDKKYHKSMAVHELASLNKVPCGIEYVTLSPVFPSVSKADHHKAWNFVEMMNALRSQRSTKVVALGGVTLKNMVMVRELGFADFAVLGSIWQPYKVDQDLKNVIQIFKAFQNE